MSVEIVEVASHPTGIAGLAVLTPKQVTDDRGTITELFRRSTIDALGAGGFESIAQINVTDGARGTLRGMHGEPMTKLLAVVEGSAFGAYVDLRSGSPTFGAVETVRLEAGVQVLVSAGIANGFQVTSERALYVYTFDREWQPDMGGVACDPLDPALGIPWPIDVDVDDPAMISPKDRDAPGLAEVRAQSGATR